MDGSPVSPNQRTALQSILTGTGRWSMRLLGPALLALGASEALAQPPAQVHQRTQPINYVGRFLGIGYSDGYHTCRSNPLPRPSHLLEGNINATAQHMLQQSYPAAPCASGNCSPQTMGQAYAPSGYYPPATMYQPTAPPQSGFPWQGGSNPGSSGMSGPTPAMPRQPQLPPPTQPPAKRTPPTLTPPALPSELNDAEASPSDRQSSDRQSSDRQSSDRQSSNAPNDDLEDPLMDAPSSSDSPADPTVGDSEALLPEETGSTMQIPAEPDLNEPDLNEPDLGGSEMSDEAEGAPAEEASGEEGSEDILPAPGGSTTEPASDDEDLLTLRRPMSRKVTKPSTTSRNASTRNAIPRNTASSSASIGAGNVQPQSRSAMRSVVTRPDSVAYQAGRVAPPPQVSSPAARMLTADSNRWELPSVNGPTRTAAPLPQQIPVQQLPVQRFATAPQRAGSNLPPSSRPTQR